MPTYTYKFGRVQKKRYMVQNNNKFEVSYYFEDASGNKQFFFQSSYFELLQSLDIFIVVDKDAMEIQEDMEL